MTKKPNRWWTPSLSWLLLLVLIFQTSLLPDILGLRGTARVANAIALSAFLIMILGANYRRVSESVFFFFLLPAGLVLLGYAINILRSLDSQALGRLGMLLPWCAALSVPFMPSYSLAASWLVFYRFMLISSVISCVEYWAVFTGHLATKPIETVYGSFNTGIFTTYLRTPDGSPHFRMHGVFPEPGTLAMWLLPAIVYALVFRKRFGLVVLPIAFFLSYSLGGFASAAVMAGSFTLWWTRRWLVRGLILAVIAVGVVTLFGNFFVRSYDAKAESATVREENAIRFWKTLGHQIMTRPLGTPLVGASLSAIGTVDSDYLGSDFAPYTALVLGGVGAMIGYSVIILVALLTSLKYLAKPRPDRLMACVFISLPPLIMFVFQRVTVFDSPLFAFLVAAPLIAAIRGDWVVAPRQVTQSYRDLREQRNTERLSGRADS
ncbi:MAG: hypothetical protein NTV05_11895 [Acidobacteria bacterium]|nr:hypothetical protein [Acidobacteriota bacterium]